MSEREWERKVYADSLYIANPRYTRTKIIKFYYVFYFLIYSVSMFEAWIEKFYEQF